MQRRLAPRAIPRRACLKGASSGCRPRARAGSEGCWGKKRRGRATSQAKCTARQGRRHHSFPLPSVSFATMGCAGSLWDVQPRTPGSIIPQRVTRGTLRASLGTFISMPQFPTRSSTVKWLVILSCYSVVKNYTIIMESPKLQRERLNIGTHIAKMRSEGTALTPGRTATLTGKELCLPLTS